MAGSCSRVSGLGALYKILGSALHLWPETLRFRLPWPPKAVIASEISPALSGVGYILGFRVATVMVSGGLLSSLVLIPAIAVWGAGRTVPLYPETEALIRDMSPSHIWTRYVRYIGAGAVATGGLLTLIRSLPTMVASFRIGAREMRDRLAGKMATALPRTEQDLPLRFVLTGVAVLALVVAVTPHLLGQVETPLIRIAGACLIALFAFFFVTVSSRIVGLVGVTSNPTSGMTIAALLGTSLIFFAAGWRDEIGKVAALTIGTVVCVAASIAGDTSQDLKTGFLLGATPRKQQIGELIGVLTSATFVCLTLLFLDRAFQFGSPELPAPQATLMKLVIEGVLDAQIPWVLVGIGVGIALVVDRLGLPTLAFAVGVYLPVATMFPVFLGGLLRRVLEKRAASTQEANARKENGILFGSGLVGGEGLVGVGIAFVAFLLGHAPEGIGTGWAGPLEPFVGLVMLALLLYLIARTARSKTSSG